MILFLFKGGCCGWAYLFMRDKNRNKWSSTYTTEFLNLIIWLDSFGWNAGIYKFMVPTKLGPKHGQNIFILKTG